MGWVDTIVYGVGYAVAVSAGIALVALLNYLAWKSFWHRRADWPLFLCYAVWRLRNRGWISDHRRVASRMRGMADDVEGAGDNN